MSYLLYAGLFSRVEDALRFYGSRRTKNGKGVTIPCQQRYCQYVDWSLKGAYPAPLFAGKIFIDREAYRRNLSRCRFFSDDSCGLPHSD
eukprot:COSAG05_NODE_1384_length_5014_cov_19.104440_4_plen_89_part_00